MKKAFKTKGVWEIVEVPKGWKSENGYWKNFYLESDAIHLQEGFYPIVMPTFDPRTQYLGNLIQDADIVTYEVLTLTLDISKIKAKKLLELDRIELNVMDVSFRYFMKLIMTEGKIPTNITTEISNFYTKIGQIESSIKNETDAEKLVKLELVDSDIEYYIQTFKNFR